MTEQQGDGRSEAEKQKQNPDEGIELTMGEENTFEPEEEPEADVEDPEEGAEKI